MDTYTSECLGEMNTKSVKKPNMVWFYIPLPNRMGKEEEKRLKNQMTDTPAFESQKMVYQGLPNRNASTRNGDLIKEGTEWAIADIG